MDIRTVIKRKGYTVKDVAKMMGVNRVTLSNFIAGNPRLSTLEQIAKTIGCSVAEFFEDERAEDPGLVCPKCGTKLKLIEDKE